MGAPIEVGEPVSHARESSQQSHLSGAVFNSAAGCDTIKLLENGVLACEASQQDFQAHVTDGNTVPFVADNGAFGAQELFEVKVR